MTALPPPKTIHPDAVSVPMSDADVFVISDFYSLVESRHLKDRLIDKLAWEQPVLRMFGREVLSPRLHAWHGDKDAVYRWSGRRWQPRPWVQELSEIRQRLEDTLAVPFNSCLVNRYRHGDDAMGWHADNEPELGDQPVIASVSFGAVRDFDLKHNRIDPASKVSSPVRIPLADGTLLVMSGQTQKYWKHRIRRQKNVSGERLNLTFRQIMNPT